MIQKYHFNAADIILLVTDYNRLKDISYSRLEAAAQTSDVVEDRLGEIYHRIEEVCNASNAFFEGATPVKFEGSPAEILDFLKEQNATYVFEFAITRECVWIMEKDIAAHTKLKFR
jgi:hypothetical protein